jgi:hypothetical protein
LGMVYGIRFTTSLIVNQPAKYGWYARGDVFWNKEI